MSLAKAARGLQRIVRQLCFSYETSTDTLVWAPSKQPALDGELRSRLGGFSSIYAAAAIVSEEVQLDSGGGLRRRELELGQGALSNLSKRWDDTKPDVKSHVECPRGSGFGWSFGQGDAVQSHIGDYQVDKVLFRMDQQDTVPSVEMYTSLLRACSGSKGLVLLKKVHSHLAKHGLETASLGNYVVSLLVKCGGLEDARQVFERLPRRTVTSWTAMICGYTNAGQGVKALSLYRKLLEEGVRPDKYIYGSLLKACGSLGDLKEGKRIHSHAVNSTCATDLVVGTCIVDMYAKCGSIPDAQYVFDTLLQRDVVSWNVMLAAYCQQGQGEKSLQLYRQMLMEGGVPDDRTFVRALQACGSLAENERCTDVDGQLLRVESLRRGQAVHAEAWRMGFDSDVYVGSTLVSMYGKCGSTIDAETVFYGLSHRNVVTWAAILSAYAQQDQAEKACHLYEQMLDAGVSPNDRSLVSMLQVLGNLADKEVDQIAAKLKFLQKGKAVHTESLRSGLAADVFVCNALLSMYAKCGSVLDAQDLFDRLSHRDVVSWNGLLAGYAQQGQGQMTFQLYHEMKGESVVSPDAGTFVILLRACSNLNEGDNIDLVDERSVIVSSLQKCKAIHADASRRGLEQDVFFSSTLISLYTKCGSLVDVTRFFDGLTEPDVVSWNAILAGHAQQGNGEKVLNLYGKMQESGVSPDAWTFVSALQACGTMVSQTGSTVLVDEELFQMHSLQQGRGLHADCQRRGYNLFGFVGNALVSMYGRCGSIVDAQNVFAGLAQRDVVSWNALLAAYVQQNQGKKPFQLFYQMQKEMVTPDSRTFVSLVQACSCLAEEEDVFLEGQSLRAESLQKGKAVHTEVQRRCYESEVFVVNSLITMYAKCGSTLDAHQVFDGLLHRTVVSWNAMLAAYAQEGEGHKSLTLYRQMLMEDVEPDESTFVCILQVCANIGALDICQQIHQCLVSDGKKLSPVVASTLIHSYGKLGRMEAALDVFEILRNSNIVTWTALIAGYAREGNYEQSLQCYEDMQLAGVKPNELTFCSLLSACSHAGMVDKGLDYFKSMITD